MILMDIHLPPPVSPLNEIKLGQAEKVLWLPLGGRASQCVAVLILFFSIYDCCSQIFLLFMFKIILMNIVRPQWQRFVEAFLD